jgi:hypothetical protein
MLAQQSSQRSNQNPRADERSVFRFSLAAHRFSLLPYQLSSS